MAAEDAPTEPVVDTRPALGSFPERFELGDELGRGGMGRVVEARDKMLDRTVALKEALGTDEDALRRFARETQITARLEHPSIVPVYDAGVSADGSPFYVMRKVTGKPLHELVGASKTLADRLALLPHVLAACQAVAHAHERGIIHRDLKPANILAGARGETIVIDWGLAKARGETDSERPHVEVLASDSLRTHAGAVFGTPGFMSPEQHASAGEVDERADVYALGATLHLVLAAKLPPSEMPGVPRELRAIVDKALAPLEQRYRNAGALAEDLARFMTGQLVAAHDYSPRERIARFVRRHRALVITIALALGVLAVGSLIAVRRVITARDEAIAQASAAEHARAAEAERASDLVVSQARLLLATNPTAAVAMVRPLAGTSRWREVRAIAAGARAAGVARRLPGPASVVFADISHAGTRALACGADGTIHGYDLAQRTHEVIAQLTRRVRAVFLDEQHVVAWVGKTFTIIDTTTKAQTAHEHAAPILRVDARDGVIYFTDERHQIWRLAAGAVVEIPVPGKVTHLAISPDGKRVAFAGEHVWLIDAAHPELVEKIHDGKQFELAWSADGEHLVTIGETHTFDITVHPEIEVTSYNLTNQAAILARGVMYTAGMGGLTIGARSAGESDLQSSMAGLHVTAGEFVVGAGRTVLRVFDGEHEHQIALPATPLTLLRASPSSPYVLAVCGDAILVWNIEHVMPKRIELPSYSQIVAVGPDRAWTITNGAPARSVDLATGATTELRKLPPLRHSSPASGAHVIARPLTSKETWLVRPDGTTETIDDGGSFAISLDDRRALIGTRDNELVLYTLDTRARQVLAKYPALVERIVVRESNPRWIVAALADGTLVRHDLTAGTQTQTQVARSEVFSPGLGTTAATSAGDVFLAVGATLRRWTTAGSVTDHVTLPRPIHAVHLLDDERILVVATDATGYIVDVRSPRFVRLPALGPSYAWGSLDPTLIVTDDRTGGVTVLDVVANASFKIARATPTSATPDISSDGTVVMMRDATLDSTAIALWRLDLPTTREATARWIEDLTNATFDPRTGMLGWPPL